MEKLVKSLSEIDYNSNSLVRFLATVVNIKSYGDGEKTPFNFTVKLEESGETLDVCSWKFEFLDEIKTLLQNDSVYEFTGVTNVYNGKEQVRIGNIRNVEMKSSRKIIRSLDINNIKNNIEVLINTYIPKKSPYREILNNLVLNNDRFWSWPAATKIHHAYPGGLAKHSLGVCELSIAAWKVSGSPFLDTSLLVAGSLLHDIGKLEEYKSDGSRNKYGDLVGHPVIGADMIADECRKMGINYTADPKIVMLRNAILSHHRELEFGSPVKPGSFEAEIIANSDALDASMESADLALSQIEKFETTEKLISCNNEKFLKWN